MRVSPWTIVGMMWASPWSLVGLIMGMCAVLSGGSYRKVAGTLEFYGGMLAWLLSKVPIRGGAAAITLGHTILGRTSNDLCRCREHEMIHVRQYEKWGPFFIPAYFAASLYLWIVGRDAYRDNPFERQAYAETTCSGPTTH